MKRACLLLLTCHTALAQVNENTPGWFPFPIPALENGPAGFVDLSALSPRPAGVNGFLRADGERIVDGKGNRVRWFGVNVVSDACFPTREEAPRAAEQLARLGVNVVRFHFLDTPWGETSLLKKPERVEWDPEAFARWDLFVAELRKRGIYANINLHVGRTYAGDPKVGPDFSKGLDNFWPPYVDELKRYTRGVLEHVNPHTGLAYKDDPGVGIIEINNENSLVLQPWWLERLPEPFRGDLETRWADFARGKYASTAALRAAWGVNEGVEGANLIANPDLSERARGWALDNAAADFSALDPIPDAPGVRWGALKRGEQNWSHQLNQRGLTLRDGQRYQLRFRMRADRDGRKPYVYTSLQEDPWSGTGLYADFEIGAAWKDFTMDFVAKDTVPGKVRLTFSARNETGWLDLAGVSLVEVPSGFLPPAFTRESPRLPLPVSTDNAAVRRDFFTFLAEVELGYARDMAEFIRRDLGAKPMVAYSQVLFGGLLGARRELLVSDVVDTHGYWHHPHFPRKPWDLADWEVTNASQLADPTGGTLAEMAMQRPAGKPYTVSEYDHPAPSDSTGESLPLFAAFAGLQDWDGIYQYNYAEDKGSYQEHDRIHRFFCSVGHPAKHAMLPVAAAIYRQGLVAPASATGTLRISLDTLLDDATARNGMLWANWRGLYASAGVQDPVSFWLRPRVTFVPEGPAVWEGPAKPAGTPSLQWDPAKGLATANTPGLRMALGKTSGQSFALGDVNFRIRDTEGDPQAHVVLVSLDGLPLATSKRMLLAALRRAENQDMGWNKERNSVGTQWGRGPAVVLGVTADIKLPAASRVEALDPSGRVKALVSEAAATFTISPAHRTVWYAVTR